MTNFILNFLYKILLKYNTAYHIITDSFDPEIKKIVELVSHNRLAIDIGANAGIYTKHLSKIFKNVIAFEPLSQVSKYIEEKPFDNIIVYNVALSNRKGDFPINIPMKNGVARYGNSSLENSIFKKFDYLKTDRLRPICEFDLQRDQLQFLKKNKIVLSFKNKARIYINNFFFLPR